MRCFSKLWGFEIWLFGSFPAFRDLSDQVVRGFSGCSKDVSVYALQWILCFQSLELRLGLKCLDFYGSIWSFDNDELEKQAMSLHWQLFLNHLMSNKCWIGGLSGFSKALVTLFFIRVLAVMNFCIMKMVTR